MKVFHNFPTKNLSFFKMGGKVKLFIKIFKKKDLLSALALAKKNNLKTRLIGAGSNTIFGSKKISLCLIQYLQKGIEISRKTKKEIVLEVSAGENWDKLVKICAKKGWSGIESLSGIPGLVGSAPVQNIGAYGTELKDVLISVEVFDPKSKKIFSLKKGECQFTYRNSVFKKNSSKFWILSIKIKLKQASPLLTQKNRREILKKRREKIPNPEIYPNVGSFFENPIISNQKLKKNLKKFPNIPHFPINQKNKVYAGWLIEQVGLKGLKQKGLEICSKNALIIINHKCQKEKDLAKLIKMIKNKVYFKFKIKLKPEVNFIT